MGNYQPAGSVEELAGFWSSRSLGRGSLIIISLVVTVSMVSDLATSAAGDARIDAGGTLVVLLACLSFYVLWTRSTFAFTAMLPALVTSHLVDSFALIMLALPVMLGFVAATATRWFSVAALGAAALWAILVPWSTPESAEAMWMALILILVGWGIGNFVGLMVDRRRQDQIRVADATRRAARAAQDERRSLARDLHDIVAHNLTIISMQARAASYADTDDSAREAVNVIGDSAGEALVDLRRMLSLLQAEGLVAGDQESAQRDLGEGASALDLEYGAVKFGRMLEGLGIETTVETSGLDQDIPQSVETALYRVLQEAITNVAKHSAEGGQCHLEVRVLGDNLELAVDNTLPSPGTAHRAGWNSSASGLIGMRDRVDAFGGTMSSARDGRWWRVRASVPLHGAAA
ncbi:sensor histidine kinase [Citricoccus nitrophenolicus]|uniref:sensor histidine kinase n=1 Tax=Citricoccus nitrophenolicus TaxID=863575 RepID=UPI0039B6BD67